MNRKGFTLIELIMVIVIIGILAAVAIPRFMDLRTEAEEAACKGSGGGLRAAIMSYYASAAINDATPVYPAALDAVTMVDTYLQAWPEEPLAGLTWGNIAYYSPTAGTLDVETACVHP